MKTDVKLLEIKGIKVPNFEEPAGEKFKKAMNEIYSKVEQKRIIRNNSITTIEKLKRELAILKNKQLMAEDEFEEQEMKKRRKDVQEQLENTEDYSGLDVDAYAKKLIGNPEIQKLKEEARLEYLKISKITAEYEKTLRQRYAISIKEVNRFMADMGSESEYRQAAVRFNSYKNN